MRQRAKCNVAVRIKAAVTECLGMDLAEPCSCTNDTSGKQARQRVRHGSCAAHAVMLAFSCICQARLVAALESSNDSPSHIHTLSTCMCPAHQTWPSAVHSPYCRHWPTPVLSYLAEWCAWSANGPHSATGSNMLGTTKSLVLPAADVAQQLHNQPHMTHCCTPTLLNGAPGVLMGPHSATGSIRRATKHIIFKYEQHLCSLLKPSLRMHQAWPYAVHRPCCRHWPTCALFTLLNGAPGVLIGPHSATGSIRRARNSLSSGAASSSCSSPSSCQQASSTSPGPCLKWRKVLLSAE
jgi:hypothetical protein